MGAEVSSTIIALGVLLLDAFDGADVGLVATVELSTAQGRTHHVLVSGEVLGINSDLICQELLWLLFTSRLLRTQHIHATKRRPSHRCRTHQAHRCLRDFEVFIQGMCRNRDRTAIVSRLFHSTLTFNRTLHSLVHQGDVVLDVD